jgi:hypothetical protein
VANFIAFLFYLVWYLGLGSVIAMEAIQWDERHCPPPHMTSRDAAGLAVMWGFAVPFTIIGELLGADFHLGDRCYFNKADR